MKKEAQKTLEIQLENLRFSGTYGLYPVEKKWTTELVVSATLRLFYHHEGLFQLKDTIDYQLAYQEIASVMEAPEELLENLGQAIMLALRKRFSNLASMVIKISKKPQLGGPCEQVTITLTWTGDQSAG